LPATNDDDGVHDRRDRAFEVIDLYDDALPQVYGYLVGRCRDRQLAEELTAETFLAALGQARRSAVDEVTVAWLIGISRHKLADHWRRLARRDECDMGDDVDALAADDPWDAVIDEHRVAGVLDALGPHHRAALTLRYLDGLSVPEVAGLLQRTVHATEALLVRARSAFRVAYEGSAR
jgi:RNA polymerase sigma-70 factor (ECF subfamily)